MIYSHKPPTRVTLTDYAPDWSDERYVNWACGWTHFLPYNAPAGHFAIAAITCEEIMPFAAAHIAHLRDMERIGRGSAAWRARTELDRTVRPYGFGEDAEPVGLPMHGPVEAPIADYRARALQLQARADRMLERLDTINLPEGF